MPNTGVTSCPLCLCANPTEDMLDFPIEHHQFLKDARAKICQACCETIAMALADRAQAALDEHQAEQGAADDQESSKDSNSLSE